MIRFCYGILAMIGWSFFLICSIPTIDTNTFILSLAIVFAGAVAGGSD